MKVPGKKEVQHQKSYDFTVSLATPDVSDVEYALDVDVSKHAESFCLFVCQDHSYLGDHLAQRGWILQPANGFGEVFIPRGI